MQKKFGIECNEEPPHRNTTVKWIKKFQETGFVHDKPPSGRKCLSDDSAASVEDSFAASPRKSVRRAALKLGLPKILIY